MNPVIVNVYQNDPDNFIYESEGFFSITDNSHLNTRAPISKHVSPRLAMYNWMEDQNPMCSPTKLCPLTYDPSSAM